MEYNTTDFNNLLDEITTETERIKSEEEIKQVYIPACANHEGIYGMYVKLRWVCPICGQPRGQILKGRSYDGSRFLAVDTWNNPCGHIDKYDDVRKEAAANGLNDRGICAVLHKKRQ